MGRRRRVFRIGLLIFLISVLLNTALLNAQDRAPSLRWLGSAGGGAPAIHIGERGEILIELTNWDPTIMAPTEIFQGMAPLNAILDESLPVASGGGSYRYTITLIPLEETNIVLAPFVFNYGTFRLNIPGINITVLPARAPQPDDVTGEAVIANEAAGDTAEPYMAGPYMALQDERQLPPFPETTEMLMPFLQRKYDQIINGVKLLWDEGHLAEALVLLRRSERDSLVGPYLAPLRREIEQSLGFGFTGNERWRPLGIPLLSYAFFLIAIISVGIFLFVLGPRQKARRKAVTFHRKKSYLIVVVSVLMMGLVLMFLEERLGNLAAGRFHSPGRAAVLRKTQGYRVPDFRGVVNDRFDEGQPVIVSDHRFEWLYAEAPDGRSGWVPREAVITY